MVAGDIVETEDFTKFVESQQKTEVETEIFWAEQRDEWLKDLDSLYARIADFLQEYIEGGSISYAFTEIEVTEPEIGEYSAKGMDIKIGRQHVSLVPIGTVLVASKGRVDVVGSAGRAQILLVDERVRSAADLIRVTVSMKDTAPAPPARIPSISWTWKILTNALQKRFVDLDKESFFALLMEIANA